MQKKIPGAMPWGFLKLLREFKLLHHNLLAVYDVDTAL